MDDSITVTSLGVVGLRGTLSLYGFSIAHKLLHSGRTKYISPGFPVFYSPPCPISILNVISFCREPINNLASQFPDLLSINNLGISVVYINCLEWK